MTAAERLEFYSMPVTECGCRLWLGVVRRDGYGKISYRGRQTSAHRAAFFEAGGVLGPGEQVLHRCDVKLCIEETHLYAGTQQRNVDDMIERGRRVLAPSCGRSNGNSRLTENEVLAIRADGRTQREIAKDYGVSQHVVHLVKSRKTWGHVHG